jgi:hypothetical protein
MNMSHIVVYESADGSSGFERCGSLDAAIVAAERLRNVESVASPRIFRLEEVQFDFRPYFRVEVNDDDRPDEPTPVERTVIPEPPLAAAPVAEPAPVEAAPEPVAFPEPTPAPDRFFGDPAPAADSSPVAEAIETPESIEVPEPVEAEPEASVFEPEAELEAIFEPEPVPENTGAPLFDSLQDESPMPDLAAVFDESPTVEATEAVEAATEAIETPEADSMVSVRKGLFGR